MLGFEDEPCWSRIAPPHLHSFSSPAQPLRLEALSVPKDDPAATARACDGLLVRQCSARAARLWRRGVAGRPRRALTTSFLDWWSAGVAAQGTPALLLGWDTASWHGSKAGRSRGRPHTQPVNARQTAGGRSVGCFVPTKSPWRNPLESKWVHGKRRVLEAARRRSAAAVEQRGCAAFGCPKEDHLTISAKGT